MQPVGARALAALLVVPVALITLTSCTPTGTDSPADSSPLTTAFPDAQSPRVPTSSTDLLGEWTVVTTKPDTNFNPVTFTPGLADGWPYDDAFTPATTLNVGTDVGCNSSGGPAAIAADGAFRSAIVYTLRGCPNTGYPPSVPLAAVEFAAIDAAGDLWLAAGDKGTFRLTRAPSGG